MNLPVFNTSGGPSCRTPTNVWAEKPHNGNFRKSIRLYSTEDDMMLYKDLRFLYGLRIFTHLILEIRGGQKCLAATYPLLSPIELTYTLESTTFTHQWRI